ncbi:MAG TPA: transcription elongation factor GreA [Bacteroidales bacterium]|nr:transcription elongation factor GreA [Bacteroidales bacterium]HRZ77362.1 transcription elongation factor GreA [Bacteroidales bacterium]
MTESRYVTEEGLRKMKEELDYLTNVMRPEISRQIAEAREKGDLSENAEYDAAKDAQGMLEMKIAKLGEAIRVARVLDKTQVDTSRVLILCRVRIRNVNNNKEMTYTLVPENEADLKAGKISVQSPIAQGLIGKRVGDRVDIQVPAGTVQFEIMEISAG